MHPSGKSVCSPSAMAEERVGRRSSRARKEQMHVLEIASFDAATFTPGAANARRASARSAPGSRSRAETPLVLSPMTS